MVKYGLPANGARLPGWQGQIGALKPAYYADVIAVPADRGLVYRK